MMTWQSTSLTWPNSAENIQSSAESVLTQVPGKTSDAVGRLQSLQSQVAFSRHSLSASAEALLNLRRELDALLVQGQVLSVHPYQHNIGTQTKSGHHLSPDEAVQVLASKLNDTTDKYHPKGKLHVVGWMIAENNLANFANATQSLYDVVNISELGMVSRRVSKVQSLQSDKMTKPETIIQPRFKPAAHLNQAPVLSVKHWQGAQLAQLESLAADRQPPVAKLAALANKRNAKLNEWSKTINDLKQNGITLHKFEAAGAPEVIATQLQQSQRPSRANSYTFASLFISAQPLTFLSELFT